MIFDFSKNKSSAISLYSYNSICLISVCTVDMFVLLPLLLSGSL